MFKATPLPAISLTIAIASFAGSATAQFYAIPDSIRATGISNDGRTATGYGFGGGFLWTAEEGKTDFGPYSGGGLAITAAISGDGRYSLLHSDDTTGFRTLRWSRSGGYEDLGNNGWAGSSPTDINGDGSVIVGTLQDGSGFLDQPFRWTVSGGFQVLRDSSGGVVNGRIEAVSDDGSTLVGYEIASGRAFTWTQANGYSVLESLPDTFGPTTSALGISRDGRFIVGAAGLESTGAMWTPDGVINLGKFSNYRNFNASEVSDNGEVIAGTSSGGPDRGRATVWTQGGGLQFLADYLADHGITLPMNVVLNSCTGISADGMTFTGGATLNDRFDTRFGYVVTIPAPASACTLLGLLVCSRRTRGIESSISHPSNKSARNCSYRTGRNPIQ